MLGLEPPTGGVPERVIRLCGVQSDVTPLSLERYGPHILPVVQTIPIDSGAHTSLLLTNWGFHESAGLSFSMVLTEKKLEESDLDDFIGRFLPWTMDEFLDAVVSNFGISTLVAATSMCLSKRKSSFGGFS